MDFELVVIIVLSLALAFVSIAFYGYVINSKRLLKSQKSAIEELTQKENHKQQLDIIASKLNPHLFKNILNSIQSHAYQTYFALDKMSNVLDYILYDSRDKYVSVKEEIQFAVDLIEINKIKLSPLFEFVLKLNVDEEDALYTEKLLAPLISIDLIENAFKHADLQSQEAYIKIIFEFQDGVLGLTVSNKASGKAPLLKDRSGIGSETFEQRLRLIYKDHYQLNRIRDNDNYIAHLKINLREYKNQMHSSGR